MIYWIFFRFHDQVSPLRVLQYITFRTMAASLTALLLSLLLGPWMIRRLRAFHVGQVVRTDGPASHKAKSGTPTMGGLLILTSVIVPTLLWARLNNPFVWIAVLATTAFGAIGFVDDYLKVTRHSHHGLFARYKFAAQVIVAMAVGAALLVLAHQDPPLYNTRLTFPIFKNWIPDLGVWYALFAVVVLVGSTNAVNLTDGLDGLAIVPVMIAAASFGMISYLTGNAVFSDYLQINYVAGTGELAVLCGAVLGAGLGFLWFNAPPASIFMGDTGSLALGGMLGATAVAVKHEIVLAVIGGLFVLEAVSVIVQVTSFKLTGKRVFRMAPLHHHFEQKGWTEPQIVIRFWIISVMLALAGLSTLKLR
jgi:phospho-N-acetylmuramoyl-pentapeptide-transferase